MRLVEHQGPTMKAVCRTKRLALFGVVFLFTFSGCVSGETNERGAGGAEDELMSDFAIDNSRGSRDGGTPSDGFSGNGSDSGVVAPGFEPAAPVLSRLTETQYRNILSAVFGEDLPSMTLSPDTNPNLFYSIGAAQTQVDEVATERYLLAASAVVAHIKSQPGRLEGLIDCTIEAPDDDCAAYGIETLGRRLLRRPLEAAEVSRWLSIARQTADGDPLRGFGFALMGLLQTPHFLYRVELGEPDGSGGLQYSPYEMASRLAFLITNSGPDDQLLDAAAAGQLRDAESIETHGRRLLASPLAREAHQAFFSQFLDLKRIEQVDRDPSLYSGFTPDVLSAMRTEVELLVDDIVYRNPRDIRGLFSEPKGYVNRALADLYGVEAPRATGSTFVPVEFDRDTPRAGILTLGAFLTMNAHQTETSPTLRGKYIRERIFCQTVPAPPDDIDLNLDRGEADPPTLRERLEQHRNDPACANCHSFIDPPGMLFEHYDSVGRYREAVDGYPVNSTGDLDGVPMGDAIDLAAHLGQSDSVMDCIVQQYFRHAQGRLETSGERAMLRFIKEQLARDENVFEALILGMIRNPIFRQVGPVDREAGE